MPTKPPKQSLEKTGRDAAAESAGRGRPKGTRKHDVIWWVGFHITVGLVNAAHRGPKRLTNTQIAELLRTEAMRELSKFWWGSFLSRLRNPELAKPSVRMLLTMERMATSAEGYQHVTAARLRQHLSHPDFIDDLQPLEWFDFAARVFCLWSDIVVLNYLLQVLDGTVEVPNWSAISKVRRGFGNRLLGFWGIAQQELKAQGKRRLPMRRFEKVVPPYLRPTEISPPQTRPPQYARRRSSPIYFNNLAGLSRIK